MPNEQDYQAQFEKYQGDGVYPTSADGFTGDNPPSAQQALQIDENPVVNDYVADASQGLSGVSEDRSGRATAIPDSAKRPQDHRKPAKRKIVVNGMDLTVDLQKLQDDYELMELMAEMEGSGEEENLPLVIKLVKSVLGDQYTMVKENCRAEEGHVSTKKMMEVIQRVFEEVGELGE